MAEQYTARPKGSNRRAVINIYYNSTCKATSDLITSPEPLAAQYHTSSPLIPGLWSGVPSPCPRPAVAVTGVLTRRQPGTELCTRKAYEAFQLLTARQQGRKRGCPVPARRTQQRQKEAWPGLPGTAGRKASPQGGLPSALRRRRGQRQSRHPRGGGRLPGRRRRAAASARTKWRRAATAGSCPG